MPSSTSGDQEGMQALLATSISAHQHPESPAEGNAQNAFSDSNEHAVESVAAVAAAASCSVSTSIHALDKLQERDVEKERGRMGQEDVLQRESGRPREKEKESKGCHRQAEGQREEGGGREAGGRREGGGREGGGREAGGSDEDKHVGRLEFLFLLSPPLRSAGFRDAKESGGDGGGGGRRSSGAVGGGGGGGVEVAEGGGGREGGSRHLELLMSCPPHQLHHLHQGAESQSFSRPQRFIKRRGQLEMKERKEQRRCKDGQGGETEKEIVEVVQERGRAGGISYL